MPRYCGGPRIGGVGGVEELAQGGGNEAALGRAAVALMCGRSERCSLPGRVEDAGDRVVLFIEFREEIDELGHDGGRNHLQPGPRGASYIASKRSGLSTNAPADANQHSGGYRPTAGFASSIS